MFKDPQGPIERFQWGRFQIDGQIHSEDGEGVGKDIFVIHGEVRAWEAREGHKLKTGMVDCIQDTDISILVIGTGVRGAIRVPKKTRKAIKSGGVEKLIIEKTVEACATYNQLVRKGKRVALLAHGTC